MIRCRSARGRADRWRQRRRGDVQNRVQRVDARTPGERPAPGEHLVEHDPGAEDVATVVDRCALRLLRRHVADGPEHHPAIR